VSSTSTTIILVIFAVLIIAFSSKSRPKEKTFKCARCKSIFDHSNRTIEAWRNKKTRFYCQRCHKLWLQSQPQIIHTKQAGGCFPVLIFACLLPTIFGIIDWFS
jgi:uncharacterized C2H2 Zn-finger protein